MTILATTFFSGFISLITGMYLLYMWRRQTPRNRSTELWGFAFLFYGVSHFLNGVAGSGLYSFGKQTTDMFITIRLVMVSLFFFFMFWGVMRIITHKKWLIYGLDILLFTYFIIFVIFRGQIFSTSEGFTNFFSFAIVFPCTLIFLAVFFILYGILIAESVRKKSGIFFINVSWFMYAILAVLPNVMKKYPEYWYTFRAISVLFILIGFIILERETREAFSHLENDKKQIHHLQ